MIWLKMIIDWFWMVIFQVSLLRNYNQVITRLKIFPETFFCILQPEYPASSSENVNEFDDITMKIKLVVRSGNIGIRFDGKLFFNTVVGSTACWDSKHYNEYNSQKIVNLSTTHKKHLKCDVVDGAFQNG